MRQKPSHTTCFLIFLCALAASSLGRAEERTEHFDADPQWDAQNNRSTAFEPREIRQDFGYSRTQHAGGEAAGEIGGFLTPDADPAYYAKVIESRSFSDKLTASGTIAASGRDFNVLVGFFNSRTLNEWRTPNTIALRLYGRGDRFYAYLEYMTQRWRAGADYPKSFLQANDPRTSRGEPIGFESNNKVHRWSLTYDPAGNEGQGALIATIDDQESICHLGEGHKADGATFDRFGLLNVIKHCDGGGEVWIDDLTINGEMEHFAVDPKWDQLQNRRTYLSENVRPRFNFGFSPTHYAGGAGAGELGGLVFRGDNREKHRLAYYGDRLDVLSLNKPLTAKGRISLRRGVTDSTSLIGFFHSEDSMTVDPTQRHAIPANFLGAAVEGPSAEGFFFYPVYRVQNGDDMPSRSRQLPHILPDGSSHEWSVNYQPSAANDGGRITVTFADRETILDVTAADRASGARFNRFGIVTTWIDGNGQNIYFDDLSYTAKQQ